MMSNAISGKKEAQSQTEQSFLFAREVVDGERLLKFLFRTKKERRMGYAKQIHLGLISRWD